MRTSFLRILSSSRPRGPRAGGILVACLAVAGLTLTAAPAGAAEFTDILDAADDKDDYDEDTYDPFDFAFEPEFTFETGTARITREAPCVPQNGGGNANERTQYSTEQCDEATIVENSEMKLRHQKAQVDLTMRVGMFKDLELRLNAPIVVMDRYGVKYAEGVGPGNSSVDPSNQRVKNAARDVYGDNPTSNDQAKLAQLSRFQQHRYFELSDQYNDISRSGFADPSIGIHWAPYNDKRDDTKATLALGATYVMPIAKIKKHDNSAVGDGMHKLRWDVRSSKQFDWIEPYFGLNYTLQLLARNSPIKNLKEVDGQNAGQSITQPPHKGKISIGTEFIPYENKETHERYAIDVRFTFGYTSEGRDYTPLFDHFSNSRCNGRSLQDVIPQFDSQGQLTNPNDLACSWIAQRPANASPPPPTYDLNNAYRDRNANNVAFQNNGIMTVESYATFAGRIGFYIQPSEYFQINGLFGLTHQQEHFLTNGRTGRDGTDDNAKVDLTGPNARLERNPAYNSTYDSPGNRFRINEYNTWSVMLNAALQF